MPASARAPTSPQSLTAPHGDAATSYPGTCRALPDDPERRANDAALLAAGFGQGAGARWACRRGREADRREYRGERARHRRCDPRAQGRARFLSSVLRRRRCGERREPGGARRRPARLDPDPAAAPDAARPARARLSPPSRWSAIRTAAASPSATRRRRSPRCAKAALTGASSPTALRDGRLPLGFRFIEA